MQGGQNEDRRDAWRADILDIVNTSASFLGLGFTPTLPVTGGAFSVLDNGALGVSANNDFVGALMFVNISFSGSSTQLSTVRMHVAVPSSNYGGGPLDYLHFATGIALTPVDLATHQLLQGQNDSIEAGSPLEPGINPMPIAGPYDLSVSFPVNSTLHQYQFAFSVGAMADGNAALDATHTALISFDLAPGITMDQSNGFLTTPGDITLPGTSGVPEPSALVPAGLGLIGLIWRRSLRRR